MIDPETWRDTLREMRRKRMDNPNRMVRPLKPKGPLFPYVQECPKCYQIGEYYCVNRDNGDILWEDCETCDGRGYIIPPEWLE